MSLMFLFSKECCFGGKGYYYVSIRFLENVKIGEISC